MKGETLFIDARRIEEGATIQATVCIIGGGVAGITLAREMDRYGIDTCLLESGGFDPDDDTRDLYRGEDVGLPYIFADGCRGRFFGGSSNCWGGWCRPLDHWDFDKREWIPHSGWPFGLDELMPYYRRTHPLLKLGPINFEPSYWEKSIGRRDVNRFPVSAKLFVLATGGIENARRLLASNKAQASGLGNGNDLVGRFFMDHPRLKSGSVRFTRDWSRNKLYDIKYHYMNSAVAAHGTHIASQLALKPEVLQQEGLLNARVWFESLFPGEGSAGAQALYRCKQAMLNKEQAGWKLSDDLVTMAANPIDTFGYGFTRVFQPRALIRGVRFQIIVEPAPNPDSRVTLSPTKKDALGMQRVRVDWRLNDQVRRTFDRTLELVADELRQTGVADVALDP